MIYVGLIQSAGLPPTPPTVRVFECDFCSAEAFDKSPEKTP